ncbi:YIP1 family protein [Halpernia frigidisoli]|uniref:Yip1 domain-containing protein n=1 Tax=Halpernia frigidisoli TaxID=1125876 RepID=A0A1I3J1S1_9FLAO|nr:YIP1 family protein [Halpernia frigidisoli]SFI53928.1 hypothetical protein SAMN05443292_2880 [Halpernia frigidisoli]
MNWKYIFNPFVKFSEKQLFIVGLVGFIILVLFSFIFKIPFMSLGKLGINFNLKLSQAFINASFSYLSAIAFFIIIAKIFNKNTRIIDIVNTITISQLPFIIIFLILNIPTLRQKNSLMLSSDLENKVLAVALLSTLSLIISACSIYSLILLFNGFKTSTNVKSWQKIMLLFILYFIFIVISQLYLPKLKL